MHEFVVVDGIIRSVLASTEREPKVSVITVEIGELLGLSSQSVHLAFETLSKGTRIEGAKLVVKRARGEVTCKNCRYNGTLEGVSAEHRIDPAFPCPVCGSPLEIERGNEWRVLTIR